MKKYLFLLFGIFIFFSCASFDETDYTDEESEVKSSRGNVNLFEDWRVSAEFKRSAEEASKQQLKGMGLVPVKLTIFDKTKAYIPAEKIFVEYADEVAGLIYIVNKPYGYTNGYEDRYDNFAFFVSFDNLYKGQQINVSKNEEIKQIGTVTVRSGGDIITLPIVILVNKKTQPLWEDVM